MGVKNKSYSLISMSIILSVLSLSLSLCLYLPVCLSFSLALGEERLKCSVFCARSLSLLFGFI